MSYIDVRIVLSIFLLTIQLSEGYFPRNEWNALYDFYNSTNGWNWDWWEESEQPHWNFSNSSVNPCLPLWQGLGCQYNQSKNEYSVVAISLAIYHLVGTISDSLNELKNLQILDLTENYLYGSIPESLYNLSNLIALRLSFNQLNGTLSESISSLQSLEVIDIDENTFTGTLPENLYLLKKIEKIALSFNNFRGSISNLIGNIGSSLGYLDFSYNSFTSSLPNSFYKLTNLTYIYLNQNNFTGTISSNISLFTKLYGINLEANNFFGSVPTDWICKKYQYLDLASNLFTGTLPACSTLVNYLILHGNSFHGTVASSYWLPSSRLKMINLGQNFFDGSIVFNNSIITAFVFSQNQFTGSIPIAAKNTYSYSIHNNYFQGELPDGIWNYLDYALLDISENYLSGPFNQVNLSNSITTMNISFNFFDGAFSLPFPSTGNTLLENLALSSNQFTGSLHNNWTVYSVLETIDVSDNQFTGSLPDAFPASIQVFSASSNCFHGSFPIQWCELPNIKTLILNGLSSSEQCRNRLFPNTIIKTFQTTYGISDGVPSCFYSFPLINSLYLSGNELTGSLPSYWIAPSLMNLDLSHNQFRGRIPNSFQERAWKELDLSFNLIDGTLGSSFYSFPGSQSSLRLQANRLSGSVPSQLIETENINILDGNLFSCNFDLSKVPQHDPAANSYSCGSDSSDAAIYLWIAVAGAGLFGIAIGYWLMRNDKKWFLEDLLSFTLNRYQIYQEYCSKILNDHERKEEWKNIFLLKQYNVKIRKISFVITIFSLFILLPCFSVLSNYFSIYEQRYSWILSPLYLEGRISAILLSLLFFLFLFSFLTFSNWTWSNNMFPDIKIEEKVNVQEEEEQTKEEEGQKDQAARTKEYAAKERIMRRAIYALGGVLNLIIMLSVDLLYVYIAINDNTTVITLSLIMMALGKIVWNSFFIWRGLTWCRGIVLRRMILKANDASLTNKLIVKFRRFSKEDIAFVSFTLGLNNLIYPAMALLILSTNCYHDALFQASDDNYSYSFNVTLTTAFDPSPLSTFSSVYTPPFTYSYKCASDIYAYYCPLFVFIFIFEGLLIPMLQLVWMHRYARKKFEEKDDNSAVELQNIETKGSEAEEKVQAPTTTSLSITTVIFDQMRRIMTGVMFFSDANDVTSHSILFHKHRYVVRFHSYLLVLLIYGTVFPPLALIGFVSIVIRTLFEEVIFGNLIELSRRRRFIPHEIEKKLNKDCEGLLDSMDYFIFRCIPIPMFIYSFLIFDTFGMNTDVVIGLIPGMILFSFYIVIVLSSTFYQKRMNDNISKKKKEEEGGAVNPLHDDVRILV